MVPIKLLVLLVISAKSQVRAEKFDFESVFQTPKRNYDDLEILERSNFQADDEKPCERTYNCIKDEPKAIANAQVLLTFPNGDSSYKQEQKDLPVIESRNYIEPDYLPPHRPTSLYTSYHLPYPPHIREAPYYYPKDIYYPWPHYPYDPLAIHNGAPFHHGNYIHQEFEASAPPLKGHGPIRTSTPAPASPRTPSTTTTTPASLLPPAKCCQIYEDLLAIIEKMARYMLREYSLCVIKFDDAEKLKIAQALNIIIKYLNIKCQDIDMEPWRDEKIDLDVDISLILEDILSVLPITLLQVTCGKLELLNEIDYLLDMVKYIRGTYRHTPGLCDIYKSMVNIFKPCIFLRDCKLCNFLSKENIKRYTLMEPLVLALDLIHKNTINEDLPRKSRDIVDLWADYLYKTQFMTCNEIFAKQTPAIENIKSTEQLLIKVRRLFLCNYALRLKEKDPNIRGVDSVISFCTKGPIVFPVTPDRPPEASCKTELKSTLNLDEVLSVVENYLKQKYNFDPVHRPIRPSSVIIPSFPKHPLHTEPLSLNNDPIVSPIHPNNHINLGQTDPVKQPNLGSTDPVYVKPQYPVNFGETDPFKQVDLGPVEPNFPELEKPNYINLGGTYPIKEINRGQEQPLYSYQENPAYINHGQTEPVKKINHGQVEPLKPVYTNLGNKESVNLGPVQPTRLKSDQPYYINLGQSEFVEKEPAPLPPSPHQPPLIVPYEEPIELPTADLDEDIPIDEEVEDLEPQHEAAISYLREDEEPVESNPPDLRRPDEPTPVDLGQPESIKIQPGSMQEIYLLGPEDSHTTVSVNLGQTEPCQRKNVQVGQTEPIYQQPEYKAPQNVPVRPIDLGPIDPVRIQQDDGGVAYEPTEEHPVDIRSVSPYYGKEPEPTESIPTQPSEPCDSQDVNPASEEPDQLGADINNLEPPMPCSNEKPKNDCGCKATEIEAMSVLNQGALVSNPLTIGREFKYPPGRPVVMLHRNQPGGQYKILTSSQPVECLSCCGSCGKGRGKFTADVDSLNLIKDKVSEAEENKSNEPSKKICKYCGGGKVYPNGRRCPFCAPYVKELDYY